MKDLKVRAYYCSGDILKKTFEYIGIFSLFIFSFIFTEKTATVIKEQDDVMIKIKEVADNYYVPAKESVIIDKTIVPGISGQMVDIDESYYKMKKMGLFNETLLVIKKIDPVNTIKNNMDKFIISGNKNLKKVSLIFLVNSDEKIKNVLQILENEDVRSNIFVSGSFMEANNSLISKIAEKHLIGNLSYNNDYNNSDFIWMSTIIKKFNDNYCYSENLDEDVLKVCSKNNSYTVVPSTIIRTKPLLNVTKSLSNGSIISFYINDDLLKELDIVIKEIKSKGYEIVVLSELLEN